MREQHLREALPIVAAALGRKFGVRVSVGGGAARTDGQVIQLPELPSDPALRVLAWGYLAHEAGHLRYTDFAAYRQGAAEGPLQAALQNILEDVRIERALAVPYPGTRATLAALVGRLVEEGDLEAPRADAHPAAVLAGYLLLALRREVLGQSVLGARAEAAEAVLRQVFPARVVRRLR